MPVEYLHLTLYYLPHHEYLLDRFDFQKNELTQKLLNIKGRLEKEECLSFDDSFTEEERALSHKMYNDGILTVDEIVHSICLKRDFDPTQHFPYHWMTFLEVPCNYNAFPGLAQLTGEREQGGLIFIPEKLYSMQNYHYQVPRDEDEKEKVLTWLWEDFLEPIIGKGSCNIRPAFRGKTVFISSDEKPIINDVINYAIHADGSYLPFAWDSRDCEVIEYLKSKSLNEALHDNSLPSEKLQNVIRKKSKELWMYIMLQVDLDSFLTFNHDFLKKNLFKEVSLEEYYQQFYQTLGFRLDSLIDSWYDSKQVPLLDIQNARAIKIGGMIPNSSYQEVFYNFQVFNRGEVPGVIMTTDLQGWIIPPHEGREIKIRCLKNPSIKSNKSYLDRPFAQNFPSFINLTPEDAIEIKDTTAGIIRLDSSAFYPETNKNTIIVDNEDLGFRVVKAKGFNLLSLFRKEDNHKNYRTRFRREQTWTPVIDAHYYGFPIQSAYVKRADTGKQKVEWSTTLPQEGKYEVFFYRPPVRDSGTDPRQELYYTIFDGTQEHEIIASVNKDDMGWISLGVFTFTKDAKVTLCDRDRKEKVEVQYYGAPPRIVPQELVADAVKWVKR